MRLTEKQLQEMIKNGAKIRDSVTRSPSYLESDNRHALLGKKVFEGFDSPVSIHFHNRRLRLADPDGISAKAVIDGIVKAGILPDDSAKYVKEVRFTQEKIKKGEIEETIITIEET